jgi:hypothetical protein
MPESGATGGIHAIWMPLNRWRGFDPAGMT